MRKETTSKTSRVKRVIKRSSDVDNISLDFAFKEFIQEKKISNLSSATIGAYEGSYQKLKTFLDDTITYANEIKLPIIQHWIASMMDDGIKPVSINSYLRNVRTFIYWCMQEDKSYIEPFTIKILSGQEEQIKTFTNDDLGLLLKRPEETEGFVEHRTWTIVNWILATGNRSNTILNIKIEDIDFSRRDIILTQQKNKKVQTIPLSHTLASVVKEYIRIWRFDAEPSDYLFCNVGNEQLSRNALRLSFSRYCKVRGVSKTSIHGLRHTFAKMWILNNGDTFRLQKMLGHSTLDMTRKYVHLFSDDLHTDFEKFNPLDNLRKGMSRKQVVKRN